jgi:hypothetical protein
MVWRYRTCWATVSPKWPSAAPKKVPQTDAIFDQLKQVNPEADRAKDTLRISIDAKATVNIGPFSRRGRSRTKTKAADHDFQPEATLRPFGIFLLEFDDLWLYMARSKVTSDSIVDRLAQWWQEVRLRKRGRSGDQGGCAHAKGRIEIPQVHRPESDCPAALSTARRGSGTIRTLSARFVSWPLRGGQDLVSPDSCSGDGDQCHRGDGLRRSIRPCQQANPVPTQ